MSATRKLSPRREQFCQEYIKDHNAAQAAIRAGYSPKWSNNSAARLCADVTVKARIAELEEELRASNDDIIRKNIELLSAIAYGDHVDTSKGMPELRHHVDGRIVQSIEPGAQGTKYKLYDRLKAVDMLNRMMGAYTDKVDITSRGESLNAPVNIVFEEVGQKADDA